MEKNRLTDFLKKFVENGKNMIYNEPQNSKNTIVIPILKGIDTSLFSLNCYSVYTAYLT